MDVTRLMKDFARHMGLGAWEAEEDGSYLLDCEHVALIFVPESRHQVLLKASFDALPEDEVEADEALRDMLRFNMARMNNTQACLTLDLEANRPLLFQRFDSRHTDVEQMEDIVSDFVDEVTLFQEAPRQVRAPMMPMQMIMP